MADDKNVWACDSETTPNPDTSPLPDSYTDGEPGRSFGNAEDDPQSD